MVQTLSEYQLHCVEALVAGTLALMTGYAQAREEPARAPMARKILANLALLADQPGVSAQFRSMLCNLLAHWHELQAHAGLAAAPAEGHPRDLPPPRLH